MSDYFQQSRENKQIRNRKKCADAKEFILFFIGLSEGELDELTSTQLRITSFDEKDVVDIYPVSNKYCVIQKDNKRIRPNKFLQYQYLEQFLHKFFNVPL